MQNKISLIIVSYNTWEVTKKCLEKVNIATDFSFKNHGINSETIVVDNASTDKSADLIRKYFPWVKLIRSSKNLGFGAGNNLGLKEAKGDYLLLLNSDAFLNKDTLVKCLDYFKKNKDCDALQINLRNSNGSFQLIAGNLPTPINTILWSLGLESLPFINQIIRPIYNHDENYFVKERVLEWSSAAFFMMKREVYLVSGGFDEKLFLYMEDVELCKRIKEKGLKICYSPNIKIVHLSGASGKVLSEDKLKNQYKGMLYYHKKHFPIGYFTVKLFLLLGLLFRSFYYLISRNGQNAKVYYKVSKFLLY